MPLRTLLHRRTVPPIIHIHPQTIRNVVTPAETTIPSKIKNASCSTAQQWLESNQRITDFCDRTK
jgi:hypothetical protein